MKTVLLTGGYGGIGNYLTSVFQENGWLVKRFKSSELDLIKDVSISSFKEKFGNLDLIIHLAYTKKKNLDVKITKNVLRLTTIEKFVYMSSWVVHNKDSKIIDGYTISKWICEDLILQKIPNAIIVRPSIVVGKGLLWQKILSLCDGIETDKTISIIHAKTLSENIYKIISKNQYGIISEQWGECCNLSFVFKELSKLNLRFLPNNIPNWVIILIAKLLKNVSSFSFLKEKCDLKLTKHHQWLIECWKDVNLYCPSNLTDLINLVKILPSPRGIGNRNSYLPVFMGMKKISNINRISMQSFKKILNINSNQCFVESGCSLREISHMISLKELALATLPEYMDVSAGACFATPIHGSSLKYSHMGQLISNVFLYYKRKWLFLNSNDDEFKRLIFNDEENYIVYALTFKVVPQFILEKNLSFQTEFTNIPQILLSSENTTIQWFVQEKRMLIWLIKHTENSHFVIDKLPQRRYNFFWAFLSQKRIIRGKSHDILGNWHKLYTLEKLIMMKHSHINFELIVPISDFDNFYSKLLKYRNDLSLVGFRISSPNNCKFENDPTTGKEMVIWIDIVLKNENLAKQFITNYKFHVGKFH